MNGKLTATLSARGRLKATLSKAIVKVEPIIKRLEITENGEYNAPETVHGFNPVNVNVPLKYEEGYEDGFQASQDSITLQEKFITENGEFVTDEGFTGMKKVIVAVPIKEEQTKTVEITKNGTTEVVADEGKTLSKVNIDVNVAFEGDIGKPYIDTSKITDFSYFCQSDRLNNYYDKIDTHNGENFERFCLNCKKMLEIPNFDTRKGTRFYYTFSGCEKIVSGKVDISNATYIDYMFNYCTKLETIELTIPKSNLGTRTFYGTNELKNVIIPNGWNVSIYLNYSYALTTESLHGMIENLADLTGQTAKTFQIGATNLAKIDEAHIQMLNDKNWNYS